MLSNKSYNVACKSSVVICADRWCSLPISHSHVSFSLFLICVWNSIQIFHFYLLLWDNAVFLDVWWGLDCFEVVLNCMQIVGFLHFPLSFKYSEITKEFRRHRNHTIEVGNKWMYWIDCQLCSLSSCTSSCWSLNGC